MKVSYEKIFGDSAQPLQEAVRKIDRRTPIGTVLSSAEMEQLPVALRERAFWTAKFAEKDILQTMHGKLAKRIGLLSESVARGERLVSRSSFIGDMRKELIESGYLPPEGKEGTLEDLTSAGRLGLIFDMNIHAAQEFARWKAGQSEGALLMFPAQELYREAHREIPRDWVKRWNDAAEAVNWEGVARPVDGQVQEFIALKSSPIWVALSRFKVPWPPFDFNSGMGVRNVGRAKTIELDLMKAGETPKRVDLDFNDQLQASVATLSPEVRADLKKDFGDQIHVEGDVARWSAQNHNFSHMWDVAADGNGAPALAPDNVEAMKRTNLMIAEIHDAADSPILPMIDGAVSPKVDGEYWPARSGALNHIGVNNPTTSTGVFVQLHEVGHYVDEWTLGGGKGFASETVEATDIANVMLQISESLGYQKALGLDVKHIAAGKATKDYWSRPAELFARAYAQWMVGKNKSADLVDELKIRQGHGSAWDDEDFALIADALDQLFEGRGLLR